MTNNDGTNQMLVEIKSRLNAPPRDPRKPETSSLKPMNIAISTTVFIVMTIYFGYRVLLF